MPLQVPSCLPICLLTFAFRNAAASAILGSCPYTHSELLSGFNSWLEFARKFLGLTGKEMPPTVDGILAWSRQFSVSGTFGNYLGHLKTACLLFGFPVDACEHLAVRRARAAVVKTSNFVRRAPMFIRHDLVARLLKRGDESKDPTDFVAAHLFLFAYVFQLRLPSEALPVAAHRCGAAQVNRKVEIFRDGEFVCVHAERRKNLKQGPLIKRRCWCSGHAEICPVHVLWPFFEVYEEGHQPFAWMQAKEARQRLRFALFKLGVPDAAKYRTHDLRRGHTEDQRKSGATAEQLRSAGQWRGQSSFLSYLDLPELDCDAADAAHMVESEDDDDSLSDGN